MKVFKNAVALVALAATQAASRTFIPAHFDFATASSPDNPWAFYNVTFFAAAEGYGASYVRFSVQNNDAGETSVGNYSTFCSAVSFPSDPINGGTTPGQFANGGLQGGCENVNATWTWDGNTLETIYHYGSGQYMPNGIEYICTIFGYADTNATTLTTKTSDCGVAKVAEKIPVVSAAGVC